MACVDSIELMPPTRSTLAQSISPLASLSVGDVAADIEAIGWQECCIRSVRTVGFDGNFEVPRVRRRFRAPPATFVVVGRRPRSKRKIASVNALTAALSSAKSSVGLRSWTPPPPPYQRSPTPPPPATPPTPSPPSYRRSPTPLPPSSPFPWF